MLQMVVAKQWQRLAGFVLVGLALSFAGCGEGDPCAEVDCEFGECDSNSGQCVNIEDCRLSEDCLPGYECDTEERACEPLEECSADEDCEIGVCSDDGACVNPDSCEENDDCLERTFCGDDGTCEPDPCNDKDCQRGECERGTDTCVSRESCTEESEQIDCVAGEKCAEGTCADEDDFCDELGCERGECSFEEGRCVNPDSCEDDQSCRDGYFCTDEGRCREDLCEANDVECEGDGVCQPAAGECENADPCDSNEDCVDAPEHICLEDECRLLSQACGEADGDGGCPGNQECEVDEEEQSAECLEPEICETSTDCHQGRQCAGRVCIEAVECRDDIYEPNDSVDEATAFHDYAEEGTLRASLCEDDIDVYTFNSADIIDPSERGELLIEVDVPRRDRGLGQVEAELIDAEGDVVGTDTGASGEDGTIRLEEGLGVADHGDFEVHVRAAGGFEEAGLEYDLSVNLIPETTVEACDEALPLQPDSRVSGDTRDAESTFLGGDCLEEGEVSSEVIYALEVDAPRELNFELVPQLSSTDLSMSVRSECTQSATEVECVDEEGEEDGTEEMTALLDEGTHYVIVQSGDEGSGGPFELTVDSTLTACSDADSYCSDGQTANLCSGAGGSFSPVECDAGCNPSTGKCYPPEGDTCLDADTLEPSDDFKEDDDEQASETVDREINLAQHNDEYRLDPAEVDEDFCMEMDEAESTRTGGPDATYRVDLPPETSVTAEVNFSNEVEGSMYLVEDCNSPTESCRTGAVESTDSSYGESFQYTNFSEQDDESLYLVVDTAEGESVDQADLELTFEEVICTPTARRCGESEELQECGEYGTKYESVHEERCSLGCETDDDCAYDDEDCYDSYCRGVDCSVAEQVPNDGDWHTYELDQNQFDNDYDIDGAECLPSVDYDDSDGPEAVFSVEADKGEVIRSMWTAREDGISYISTDCDDIQDTCVAADETTISYPVPLEYEVEEDDTYYIFADVNDSSSEYGDSEFAAQVLDECDPESDSPTCDGDDVEACRHNGGLDTFACDGGCSDGRCDESSSNHCYDAENITSEASADGGLSRTIDWGDFDNDYMTPDTCGIGGPDISGPDAVYEVDLEEDQWLFASMDNGESDADPALIVTEDCEDPDEACNQADEDTSTAEIEYFSESDKTVYLIADTDSNEEESDDFEIDVEVRDVECEWDDPTTCDGNSVEYCDEYRFKDTYDCTGGCSDGECGDPQGDACPEAISLDDGDTFTDTYEVENRVNPVDFDHIYGTGDCTFAYDTSAEGYDHVFEIDLKEGEKLDASYTTDFVGSCSPVYCPTGDSGANLYVMQSCTGPSTCQVNSTPAESGGIEYTADEEETVYLIRDTSLTVSGSEYEFTLDVTID